MLFRCLTIAALLSAGAWIAPASATGTSAHAMVVSGNAGHFGGGVFDCATSGPQPGVLARFGSGVGLPTEGYSYCGLTGGIKDSGNPNGQSTASQSVTNTFGLGVHNQTADATADFGVLKVSSNGSYTGNAVGAFAYHAGEAAAVSTDTLPTPLGGKFLQFGVTIDGSASIAGSSQILTFLNYQINNGPIFTFFVGDLADGTAVARDIFGNVAGFTVTTTSISGSGTVFSLLSDLPVGPTFDLTLGLYAASYPGPFVGVANNDFHNTARLSSLSFYDASRNPIAFGSIVGASGRIYDADGVHTAPVGGVPEPASWAMLLIGFAAVGISARRSARTLA